MLSRTLVVILEDAPAVKSSAAIGLSKALTPTLIEIAPSVNFFYIVQTHSWLKRKDIQIIGARTQITASYLQRIFARSAEFLPFPLKVILIAIQGVWIGFNIASNFGMKTPKLPIWTTIGIDPMSLLRLFIAAKFLRADYEISFVDDIEAHPNNRNLLGLNYLLAKIIKGASKLYAITPELGDRFRNLYGVTMKHLPLSMDCPNVKIDYLKPSKYFVTYLGSINHLYSPGLSQLISHTKYLRANTGLDLKIRIISNQEGLVKILGDNKLKPDWIECGMIYDDSELGSVLANSRISFLPYSFDSGQHSMGNTSFPSKLLDYLAWSRAILVYAPENSIPAAYFNKNKLDFIVHNTEDLYTRLLELAYEDKNNSEQYRKTLKERHNPKNATEIILGVKN